MNFPWTVCYKVEKYNVWIQERDVHVLYCGKVCVRNCAELVSVVCALDLATFYQENASCAPSKYPRSKQ